MRPEAQNVIGSLGIIPLLTGRGTVERVALHLISKLVYNRAHGLS